MTKKKKIILSTAVPCAVLLSVCLLIAASGGQKTSMTICYAQFYTPAELLEESEFIGVIRLEEKAGIDGSSTLYRASVREAVKGGGQNEILFRAPGYKTWLKSLTAEGEPLPEIGKSYLIFAKETDGVYTAINNSAQGRFEVPSGNTRPCAELITDVLSK